MQIPVETAFAKRAREAFLPRSTVTVIQPAEQERLDREMLADTVRRDGPVVGREECDKSGSVRVALMEDHWASPETLAICMMLRRSPEALRLTSEGPAAKKTPS